MAQQYNANFKPWDHQGTLTPNLEVMEGVRPGIYKVADYLPLVRFDKYFEEFYVIHRGKAVALDHGNAMVPAGLKAQIDWAVDGAGAAIIQTGSDTAATQVANLRAAAAANNLTVYTQTDVDEGVVNAAGNAVVAGECVIESFLDLVDSQPPARSSVRTVSEAIGVNFQNAWRWVGGDGVNPANFRQHNHNLQHGVGLLCDYVIELPAVTDTDYANAAMTGVAAAIYTSGSPFKPGDFLKYDFNSNWVKADLSADTIGNILGQIIKVDTDFPKDYLDRVKTAYDNLGSTAAQRALNQMPGSASSGMPDAINFAGGSSAPTLLWVNLINR